MSNQPNRNFFQNAVLILFPWLMLTLMVSIRLVSIRLVSICLISIRQSILN